MTNNNGKLYLEIESQEFEVECAFCKKRLINLKESYMEAVGTEMGEVRDGFSDCPTCHGTGKRTVKLVGMVEFKMIEDCKYGELGIFGFDETFDVYNLDWMAKIIAIRYRSSGTPPTELMADTSDPSDRRLRIINVNPAG